MEILAAIPAKRDRKGRTECERERVACSRSSGSRLLMVASIRSLWTSIPATAVVFHLRQRIPSLFQPEVAFKVVSLSVHVHKVTVSSCPYPKLQARRCGSSHMRRLWHTYVQLPSFK